MAPVAFPMLPSDRFAAVQREAKQHADDILKGKGLGPKVVAHGARLAAGVLGVVPATVAGTVADLFKLNRGSLSIYGDIFRKGTFIAAGGALLLGLAAASPMTSVMALAWGAAASLVFSPAAHAGPNATGGVANWAYAKVAGQFAKRSARPEPLQLDIPDPDFELPRRVYEPTDGSADPRRVELEQELSGRPRFARLDELHDEPDARRLAVQLDERAPDVAPAEHDQWPASARVASGPELYEDMPERPDVARAYAPDPDARYAHIPTMDNPLEELRALLAHKSGFAPEPAAEDHIAFDSRGEPAPVAVDEAPHPVIAEADAAASKAHLIQGRGYVIDTSR